MSIAQLPRLLAEIAPKDQELTVGTVLAGFCVMAVLAGSVSVLAMWWGRISRGESVIPMTDRPLLRIPVSLLMFGMLIGVMMAVFVLSASLEGEGSALQLSPPVVENVELDVEKDDASGTKVSDVGLSQGDRVDEKELATQSTTDLITPASPDLTEALLQTVAYDIAMILMLGIPVLLMKLRRRPTPNPAAFEAALLTDVRPSGAAEPGEAQNPYVESATIPAAPLEFRGSGRPAAGRLIESWQLGRELRFAAEACLAAWLPTAVLKLTMVMILQDEGQHPFLEMIMNGVGIKVLLLIAVTTMALAPLMEELLYRVVILGGLLNHPNPTRLSTSIAIGMTSVLFAFAHGFPDSIALLPLAVTIGWTYHQRRSYRTVVLVHFFFNGFNILIAGLGML